MEPRVGPGHRRARGPARRRRAAVGRPPTHHRVGMGTARSGSVLPISDEGGVVPRTRPLPPCPCPLRRHPSSARRLMARRGALP
ncbi:MAG: hypothetical protein EPO40_13790 [Myxococcaceae bacterium]|nr:MAG: hypothetical protein EPO40_13790 [Myxococcaceae bacterium]